MASRIELPDKLYFKIGEVASLTGVKQHVLRYWESEFAMIRPQKSKTNQRLYKRRDVEAVFAVKHLLYDLKFTIEGARKHLKEEGLDASLPPPDLEKLAASIREKAAEELEEAVASTRAQLLAAQEKDLLTLRKQVLEFQKSLEEDD